MKARIVIGANYGDEGKGTVVANYTKNSSGKVLNVLTNGGSQRGHSILTKDGSMTFQHFGAGTYHGADNYYSRFFILNPMQFVREYESLIVKPKVIYRDPQCRWTTPYDIIANQISEELQGRHASCGMGIWNTINRYNSRQGVVSLFFDDFMAMDQVSKHNHLKCIKHWYEKTISIPDKWKEIWNSSYLIEHFINDCIFMYDHTKWNIIPRFLYDDIIFENGQGLMISDKGEDSYDATPSDTGINYALSIIKDLNITDVTAHYVTRPYLTRHGDGHLEGQTERKSISSSVEEDRTNHFNGFQGEFRYGHLDIEALHKRILEDCKGTNFELDVTHCDEMDRVAEFSKVFDKVNTYDSPLV